MSFKKSQGNMYDWVSHMHSHLAGECPHKCSYCYVQRNRFGVSDRYKGEIRLIRVELNVNYGTGKTIFIEHMNDLFAAEVPGHVIEDILDHCYRFPGNNYVFQTKNPERVLSYEGLFPVNHMIGTTIETNIDIPNSKAPRPESRFRGISALSLSGCKTFITIEPIMDFDPDVMIDWIVDARPEFVNIGADSKHCQLPEPDKIKLEYFIAGLNLRNITIKKKMNLERLLK